MTQAPPRTRSLTGFDTLSNDDLASLFASLSPQARLKTACVCQRFARIITGSPYRVTVWEHVDLDAGSVQDMGLVLLMPGSHSSKAGAGGTGGPGPGPGRFSPYVKSLTVRDALTLKAPDSPKPPAVAAAANVGDAATAANARYRPCAELVSLASSSSSSSSAKVRKVVKTCCWSEVGAPDLARLGTVCPRLRRVRFVGTWTVERFADPREFEEMLRALSFLPDVGAGAGVGNTAGASNSSFDTGDTTAGASSFDAENAAGSSSSDTGHTTGAASVRTIHTGLSGSRPFVDSIERMKIYDFVIFEALAKSELACRVRELVLDVSWYNSVDTPNDATVSLGVFSNLHTLEFVGLGSIETWFLATLRTAPPSLHTLRLDTDGNFRVLRFWYTRRAIPPSVTSLALLSRTFFDAYTARAIGARVPHLRHLVISTHQETSPGCGVKPHVMLFVDVLHLLRTLVNPGESRVEYLILRGTVRKMDGNSADVMVQLVDYLAANAPHLGHLRFVNLEIGWNELGADYRLHRPASLKGADVTGLRAALPHCLFKLNSRTYSPAEKARIRRMEGWKRTGCPAF